MANVDRNGERTLTGANDSNSESEGTVTNTAEETADLESLRAELAVLREENDRLRSAYAAARKTQHRRTALGFAVLGFVAVAASLLLPGARDVLLALGGTGLFAGLLVVYLSPERFVAASVGRDVYGAMADNEQDLVTELGLSETRVYAPIGESGRVRLFIPQHADYALPDDDELTDLLVVPGRETARGIALRPTGAPLVDEYEQSTAGTVAADPAVLAEGLAEALVEQFEVLDSVSVDSEPGRVTVAVSDSAFGPINGFDHPVGSVLAVGLARAVEEPVELAVRTSEGARTDWQVTCRWGDAQ